jgi:hypothetical protein
MRNIPVYRTAVTRDEITIILPTMSTQRGQAIRMNLWSVRLAIKEFPRAVMNPKIYTGAIISNVTLLL